MSSLTTMLADGELDIAFRAPAVRKQQGFELKFSTASRWWWRCIATIRWRRAIRWP
jgi:hypothetical protein